MATTTDSLKTVLQLVGAQQYIQSLNQVAQAHRQLAAAQVSQAAAQQQAAGAAAGAGGAAGAGLLGGTAGLALFSQQLFYVLAIAQGMKMLAEGFMSGARAAGEFDAAVFRSSLTLRNLGQQVSQASVSRFSLDLSTQMGVSPTQVAQLTMFLARYRMTAEGISEASKIIVNASKATGIGVVEMAQMIEGARFGHGREMLKGLGIPIRVQPGQVLSFNQVLSQIQTRTRDATAGFNNTLPGSMERASASLERLNIVFHQLTDASLIKFENAVTNAASDLAYFGEKLLHWGRRFGLFGGQAAERAEQAAAVRGDRDRYLREIAQNTGPQGPLAKALRGGGSFDAFPGGLRIRDFNQAMRHVR